MRQINFIGNGCLSLCKKEITLQDLGGMMKKICIIPKAIFTMTGIEVRLSLYLNVLSKFYGITLKKMYKFLF